MGVPDSSPEISLTGSCLLCPPPWQAPTGAKHSHLRLWHTEARPLSFWPHSLPIVHLIKILLNNIHVPKVLFKYLLFQNVTLNGVHFPFFFLFSHFILSGTKVIVIDWEWRESWRKHDNVPFSVESNHEACYTLTGRVFENTCDLAPPSQENGFPEC